MLKKFNGQSLLSWYSITQTYWRLTFGFSLLYQPSRTVDLPVIVHRQKEFSAKTLVFTELLYGTKGGVKQNLIKSKQCI